MESRSRTAIRGISGDHDAPSGDLELVAAAKGGSKAAFEELQSRYSRRLYRRIQFITRNHEDAEDALQETFLHAYLALGISVTWAATRCSGRTIVNSIFHSTRTPASRNASNWNSALRPTTCLIIPTLPARFGPISCPIRRLPACPRRVSPPYLVPTGTCRARCR